jgi:hypothetical protein
MLAPAALSLLLLAAPGDSPGAAASPEEFRPGASVAVSGGIAPEFPLTLWWWAQGSLHLSPRIAGTAELGALVPFLLATHLQVGPTLYLAPPRPLRVAPFVSAKAGLGAFWLCVGCGDDQEVTPLLVATTSGGLEFGFKPSVGSARPNHVRLILEGGVIWMGELESEVKRFPFGRVGMGVVF